MRFLADHSSHRRDEPGGGGLTTGSRDDGHGDWLARHGVNGENHCMPGIARASVGGCCCHALNRGNGQTRVCHDTDDHHGFVMWLRDSCARVPIRLAGHCLMRNHCHLVLWTHGGGDLSTWIQWLQTTQAHGYRQRYRGAATFGRAGLKWNWPPCGVVSSACALRMPELSGAHRQGTGPQNELAPSGPATDTTIAGG